MNKIKKDKNITIAYADDNIIFRKGISGLLEQNGDITVQIQADNGLDLLDKLHKATQLPDICLIDINMPGMNGFEVTPLIRKEWPDMGIVAYSSWNDEYNIMQMINKGANGYMVKGYPIEDLIKALRYTDAKGIFCAECTDDLFYELAGKHPEQELDLSDDERRLLLYSSQFDLLKTDIPGMMEMTEDQAETIKMDLYSKLHVRSRAGLALYALQTGLAEPDLS